MINSVLVKFVTVPAPPSDLRVLPGFQKSGSNAGNCNRTSNSLVRAVQTILWLQEKVDIKNLFFLWSETALSCASVWFWNCASASQIFGSSPAFRKAAATPPTTHVHQIIRSDQYKRLKVSSSASRFWLEKIFTIIKIIGRPLNLLFLTFDFFSLRASTCQSNVRIYVIHRLWTTLKLKLS